MSYGLNLGWGGPIGDYIGFWGGTFLRDILQISSRAHVGSIWAALLGKSAHSPCVVLTAPTYPYVVENFSLFLNV